MSLWLLLIALGRESVAAGADGASLQAMATLLRDGGEALNPIGTFAFSLGALMLYTLLYQSQLVPRWISVWGYVAILLHLGRGVLVMFHVLSPFSAIDTLVNMPIGVQEMVMAVWFIVKGFSPKAVAALPAEVPATGALSAA